MYSNKRFLKNTNSKLLQAFEIVESRLFSLKFFYQTDALCTIIFISYINQIYAYIGLYFELSTFVMQNYFYSVRTVIIFGWNFCVFSDFRTYRNCFRKVFYNQKSKVLQSKSSCNFFETFVSMAACVSFYLNYNLIFLFNFKTFFNIYHKIKTEVFCMKK